MQVSCRCSAGVQVSCRCRCHAGVSSHFLNSLIYIGSGKLAAQWTEKEHAGVSSHFLNSLIYIGSGKLAAQWTEKEHDFGTRHAKSPNFLREDVEISVIHDWPF
jgi:hypothetical protein